MRFKHIPLYCLALACIALSFVSHSVAQARTPMRSVGGVSGASTKSALSSDQTCDAVLKEMGAAGSKVNAQSADSSKKEAKKSWWTQKKIMIVAGCVAVIGAAVLYWHCGASSGASSLPNLLPTDRAGIIEAIKKVRADLGTTYDDIRKQNGLNKRLRDLYENYRRDIMQSNDECGICLEKFDGSTPEASSQISFLGCSPMHFYHHTCERDIGGGQPEGVHGVLDPMLPVGFGMQAQFHVPSNRNCPECRVPIDNYQVGKQKIVVPAQ